MRPVLDEQRRLVEHDVRAGIGPRGDLLRARGGDPRVRDAAEVGARGLVGEGDRREPLAVELAVGGEDRRAEPRDQLRERRLTRLDDLARELIGVDHGGAALREHARDGALARRDAPGQPDHVHRHG
jgi:hypothetical protein